VVTRRARWQTLCARRAYLALQGVSSTSPLERGMNRRSLVALGAGVAVLWLTQWSESRVIPPLLAPRNTNLMVLGTMASSAVMALVFLLPGFCAGCISKRRGIALGALTGLVGSLTYSILFMTVGLYSLGSLHKLTAGSTLLWFWDAGPGLMLTCAAGGAAGQLLRSNSRSRGS
jgi:hypothetical protein